MCKDEVVALYDRHAQQYDLDRGRSLQEREWLDRFLVHVGPRGRILDIGCGTGEPIARYMIERGHDIVGVDSSPAMIDLCRTRFPDMEWLVSDMRTISLGRRFEGLLAWDSFFHLGTDDQRGMFSLFALHALPGAGLMFTSGPAEGEAVGTYRNQPLYHASLSPAEYNKLLSNNGFEVQAFVPEDPACGGHTVWLATCGPAAANRSGYPSLSYR
jgi:SAM-dependent methyltransferase